MPTTQTGEPASSTGVTGVYCYGTMAVETPFAFFSYSRDDSQFALQLATDLKASGFPVWLDQLDIRPDQRWDKAVEDALANCPRMLVILSPSSVGSTNVLDEVSFALEEQKIVIPVLHRECKIPFRLRRVQYVDFRGEYATGLRNLLRVMGARRTTGAAPVLQYCSACGKPWPQAAEMIDFVVFVWSCWSWRKRWGRAGARI